MTNYKYILITGLITYPNYICLLGLVQCGLDCQYLIEQGYDGANNMSGKFQGVQSYIQTQYSKQCTYTVRLTH